MQVMINGIQDLEDQPVVARMHNIREKMINELKVMLKKLASIVTAIPRKNSEING